MLLKMTPIIAQSVVSHAQELAKSPEAIEDALRK
jgi:hypothetical protein